MEHGTTTSTGPADVTTIDGVAVLHWPRPGSDCLDPPSLRLSLAPDGDAPPLVWGPHEAWVRAGGVPAEVTARAARPSASPPPQAPTPRPTLDADGLLRAPDGRWVVIPPIEARMLAPCSIGLTRWSAARWCSGRGGPVARSALEPSTGA